MRRRSFITTLPALAAGVSALSQTEVAQAQAAKPTPPVESSANVPPLPYQPAGADRFVRPDVHGGDRPFGASFASRSAVFGLSGAAGTAQPLATQAAIETLKKGGSAVDAAIAANACLGFLEPTSSGLGGDCFAMLWDPKINQVVGIAGSGRSPQTLTLSDIAKHQGRTIFFQGPAKKYDDAALSRWLHDTFFEGHGLLELYGISLAQGLLVFLIALPFGVRADVRRFRELKYGRRLKGPIMLDPAQFNRALKADGLGIETTEKPKFPNKKSLLRIPKIAEAKHIQIMGDTGTGKSTIIKQLLQQIADRGEVAIVYDPAGEFTETFYKESRAIGF